MFTYGIMPPLMFVGMILFMLYGFPVAFSLAAVGLFFGVIGILTGHFDPVFLQALPHRFFGIVSNDLLLAIPFFTFMGAILERCGLAEDLLEGTGKLFGAIPGGLAYAVIVVGAILGAITGTVAASVITMGVISLPIMLRYGYNQRLATGVIAASGTITQLIPPSLVLVVLADQLGRSVGDMYLGAIGPSLLQVAIFLVFILILSIVRPKDMPPLPPEVRGELDMKLLFKVLAGMIPSIVLIFLVLGTIFMGLATPTEAGALGVVGAMALAAMHRRLTWPLIRQGMSSTMHITSMVVFILIGSTCFSLVFQGMDGSLWIEHLLTGLPGGPIGFLIFVNIFIFILAFFLDFFEIAFIVIPMLAPVAQALGIDLIWFGVLICINMQTSFMHPPFGFALFYLRSIAPREVKTTDIYMGALPWLVMQLILVAVVIFWPQSVTHWLDKGPQVDPNSINIIVPGFGENTGDQMPNFGLPPIGSDDKGNTQLPGLSLPALDGLPGEQPAGGEQKPEQKPKVDLSQPPIIQ
ncbi:C4-dicarboxylate ABC transporter [Metarhizobium album]|uniref:TRAP transporter large permease protein n=1 Tax=Metarhizobium album TaxID=2182425 RepID=A0A2U2DVN0_9HYPH|nr:TRAP transporter large permease subunit [Rhizobium album]PWE57378.1 C4-dicarboxylate ABC transporter [Rhizobium album]